MSDLTVTSFTSTTGTRAIDFTGGNLIVSNNAGGTLVVMSDTSLTVAGNTGANGIEVRNTSAVATTVQMPASTEASSINCRITTGTYALDYIQNARNLDFTGFAGSLSTNRAVSVFGNLTFGSGMTSFTTGSNNWAMKSTNASQRTLTTNSRQIAFPIQFDGIGGSFLLADDLTFNGSVLAGNRNLFITNGTVNFNNRAITNCNSITQSTGGATVTISNLSTSTTMSHTNGTINCGSNITSGAYSLTGGTFNLLTFAHTLPSITWSGAGAKTLDFGTSGKFVINANTTSTIVTGTATAFTLLGTNPLIECAGGTAGGAITKTIATGNQTASTALSFSLLDTSSSVSYVFTGSTPNACRNLLINGTQNFNNSTLTIFGNYTYDDSSGTKVTTFSSGTAATTFASTGSATISVTATSPVTHDFPWTFDGVGGTFTLSSNVTVGSTRATTLTNGTLNLSGRTYTTGSFVTAAGTKTLTFNGGTLVVSGAGATAFNNAANTGFTINQGTGTATISMTSASAKTFVGAGISYPVTFDQGGTGDLTVTGVNTFNNLSGSVTATGTGNILFPAGSTTTFTNLTTALAGSLGNRVGIFSATAGTRWNLTVTNGSIISLSGVAVRDCNPNIGSGQRFIALEGLGCTNRGNNVNWTFGNESLAMFC